MVPRAPGLGCGSSGGVTRSPRPSVSTPVGSASSRSHQASTSCLETLQRSTRAAGFSSGVASQVGLARRASSRTNYQLKWLTFRSWCCKKGHSISCPSVSKVADFLLWLHRCRGLSVSSIMGYRSILSAVFRFQLPELSSHPELRDLLRSFRLAAPCRPLRPPAWDLAAVLTYLNSVFEPLRVASLRNLTKKVLFLLAPATAKHVGELQALSRLVSFVHVDACVSYAPEFVAKTVSLSNPIPRSFLVKSLSDFCSWAPGGVIAVSCVRPSHLSRQVGFVFPFTLPSFSFTSLAFACFIEECHLSFSATRSLMRRRQVGQSLVLFVPIALGVCPPRLHFTTIGRLPVCWNPLRGGPIRCLCLFTCVIFSMKLMVSNLWVRS